MAFTRGRPLASVLGYSRLTDLRQRPFMHL